MRAPRVRAVSCSTWVRWYRCRVCGSAMQTGFFAVRGVLEAVVNNYAKATDFKFLVDIVKPMMPYCSWWRWR